MDKENNIPEGLTPYRIAITETYVKEVVIYAKDSLSAEEMADTLCGNDDIELDYDNFADRSTECRGVARPMDLELHQVFGLEPSQVLTEDFAEKSGQKLSLNEQMSAAAAKTKIAAEPEGRNNFLGSGGR